MVCQQVYTLTCQLLNDACVVIVIYPQCFTVANNSSDVLTDLLQEPYGNVNNTFCQHYFCIGKYR